MVARVDNRLDYIDGVAEIDDELDRVVGVGNRVNIYRVISFL